MGKWDYYNYTPASPREVKGGIKSQSKRGAMSKNWWAKRWNQVLESFNIGARLSRGRAYARKGQVASIDIKKGEVTSKVQGTRAKPYKIEIKMKVLTTAEWQKVIDVLCSEAIFVAKLLAGEMPQDIEEVFAKAGVSLFPERENDLETDCSCPDWSNPCKHIAAVYYILGQEFDRDPFLIFKLRGLEREELLAELTGRSGATCEERVQAQTQSEQEKLEEQPEFKPEELSAAPDKFWRGAELPHDFLGDTEVPKARAVLLKQLGDFPFWRGQDDLTEVLEPVYFKASSYGMKFVAGIFENDEKEDE